ncbi:MAG TPA: hypothetical protein DEB46_05715 [Myxococcales bacterium]|nr:hypothetical protein [Myxococcales bacterium]
MSEEQQGLSTGHERVDRFGVFASSACALHCAVCALVPAAFAVFGLDFLLGEKVEWTFTLVAVGFGCLAFYLGWQRHRQPLVFSLLGVGIIGLLAVRVMAGHGDHHAHGAHHTAAGAHDADGKHGEHENHGKHGKHGDHDEHEKPTDHAAEEKHDEHEKAGGHEAEENHGEHADHGKHDDHDDHGPGEGLGIFAGLILVAGHLTNLRAMRSESCQESPEAATPDSSQEQT